MGDILITLSLVIAGIGGFLLLLALLLPLLKKSGDKYFLFSILCFFVSFGLLFVDGKINGAALAEAEVTTPSTTEFTHSDISYDEIYKAYKKNELVADDIYKDNRYRITAKINGMATGGLFNLTGGATLTMEIKVENTIVFFYAEFEKAQEESLKQIVVGDTITFEGTCLSAGMWIDCEIVN